MVVEAEVNGRTTSLLRVKGEVSFAGAVGQPRFESSLLGDPGAKFSIEKRVTRKKRETDACDLSLVVRCKSGQKSLTKPTLLEMSGKPTWKNVGTAPVGDPTIA